MSNDSVCYKIRDANTGLFSTGGYNPRWTKNGKAWSHRGHLLNHLIQYHEYGNWKWNKRSQNDIPEAWEIVTFRVVQETSNVENAQSVFRKYMENN